MRRIKDLLCFLLIISLLPGLKAHAALPVPETELGVSAPSAILCEKETGAVIYEKNAHERYFPASITKIMTMLLIVEELESGRLTEDDTVTASDRAASFGGSCVYLESGERMSVRDMLKCIAVVSANDCAVAMAEHISGSEEKFVLRMNERAAQLGMKESHFTNCSGLFDDGEHYTTAWDVALMSRELIRHERIKDYTTIWMDSIRGGDFELSNTNKLAYWYPGCTGLKTGYTSSAMFCLSATAEREGVEYIAVVMHAKSADERNSDAELMLDYAFYGFTLCSLRPESEAGSVPVELGRSGSVSLEYGGREYALVPRLGGGAEPEYSVERLSSVRAPVKQGDRLGTVTVRLRDETVAEVPLLAAEDVPRLGFFGLFKLLAGTMFGL